MVNKLVKYGFKPSGVLPEARKIFKHSIIHPKRQEIPDTGYAKDVPHPKNSTRNLILPKYTPVKKLIANTIKNPKKKIDFNSKQFRSFPKVQQVKLKKAKTRRDYLLEAYTNEEQKILQKIEAEKQKEVLLQQKRKEQRKLDMKNQVFVKKNSLTLPTISSFLKGPLVRRRTEDEKKILMMKKKANYNNSLLIKKENQAERLLELYYKSKDFVITEEKLKEKIEKAFEIPAQRNQRFNLEQQLDVTLNSGVSMFIDQNYKNVSNNAVDKLLGTHKNAFPDADQIIDEYNGVSKNLYQKAQKNLKKNPSTVDAKLSV
ncbi:mitochondrial 37S ribosomal protein mS26 PET123 ASCRUDRAFT_12513 [Ascoidea rubescens DSM 1968]|uniref:Uncharacterized protein n=1 Tax=Ascoidea rubescens DSM 1968 TaxID=1344418 RepID=A0A1D2VLJ4_9ASCO|nr:hypothetical protein ASCRUDRAFT_12513 [Ascoidea rubescens DSM 1968]ODV62490.1 hypothetical protein ASCRUDRAFT_12513 [Ascoidea rubescens DSM 1968]